MSSRVISLVVLFTLLSFVGGGAILNGQCPVGVVTEAGQVIHVNPFGPSGQPSEQDYACLVEAFSQVGPGGTVQLAVGEYYLTQPLIVDDFTGTFAGRGPDATIIRPASDLETANPPTSGFAAAVVLGDRITYPSLFVFRNSDVSVVGMAVEMDKPIPIWVVAGIPWIDPVNYLFAAFFLHDSDGSFSWLRIEGTKDTGTFMGTFSGPGYSIRTGIFDSCDQVRDRAVSLTNLDISGVVRGYSSQDLHDDTADCGGKTYVQQTRTHDSKRGLHVRGRDVEIRASSLKPHEDEGLRVYYRTAEVFSSVVDGLGPYQNSVVQLSGGEISGVVKGQSYAKATIEGAEICNGLRIEEEYPETRGFLVTLKGNHFCANSTLEVENVSDGEIRENRFEAPTASGIWGIKFDGSDNWLAINNDFSTWSGATPFINFGQGAEDNEVVVREGFMPSSLALTNVADGNTKDNYVCRWRDFAADRSCW